MTDTKLKLLVTEAVKLDRTINELDAQLKAIKETLAIEAGSREELAVKTEGGGTSTVLEGMDGCVARVTEAGRTLKASINGEGAAIVKVKDVAGTAFSRLFTPVVSYKPVDDFRARTAVELGATHARALFKLVENPGRTSVAFETKEVAS